MEHPEVEGQLREVDVLPHRIARRFGGFVEGVEVGTCFHFDHREALPVIEVEIPAILQEGAANRHRALVVQRGAIHEEGRHAVEAETVVQPVRVFRVFFVDDVRDHDVADAAVEGRRLAEHIDAAQRPDTLRHFAQHVVGAQPERVVDVDQDSRAALQSIRRRTSQPRIEVVGDQPVENDHLRRHVEAGLTRQEKDAALLFFRGAERPPPLRLRRLPVVGARRVIEEVVPVAARLTLAELAQLGDQLQVFAAFGELDDLVLVPARGSAQQVHEAMGVARDEVDGPVAHALALHQGFDRLPPAAGGLDVADLGATQHPDPEIFLLSLDSA